MKISCTLDAAPRTSGLAMRILRTLLVLNIIFASYLTVTGAFEDLRITVEPTDSTVPRGHAAILLCSAQHPSQTPSIQWMRDGDLISFDKADSHRRLLQNGSLLIESATNSRYGSDNGVYQCVATIEGVGSVVSKKAALTLAYLDSNFQSEPQDLAVHLGDTAVFRCSVEGQPKPSIKWKKDIDPVNTNSDGYFVHDDGTLEIKSVTFTDFGSYSCEAENSAGSKTSNAASLSQNPDVNSKNNVSPKLLMSPKDTFGTEGSTVTFYCAANGRDRQRKRPSISWLKDGATIDIDSKGNARFSITGQGSLKIDNLEKKDTGSYTCRATNMEDSVDAEASLRVNVPPALVKTPMNTRAHTSSEVTFECEAEGVPQPTIQWLKDGDVVIPSDYFQIVDGRNLKVLGLVNSDSGIYQCFAENSAGSKQASAQLLVTAKENDIAGAGSTTSLDPNTLSSAPGSPSAPGELATALVSTRFVTLSWQMPVDSGSSEITHYIVSIKEEGSSRVREINATQVQVNIEHLKPMTKYQFKVAAVNKAGRSAGVAELTVTTKAEVHVPGPPTNLVAAPLSSTSIEVSWDPPQGEGQPVSKYQLHYYRVGDSGEKELDITDRQHVLEELKEYAEYSFRVVAFNSNGAGVSTDEVVARTYSDVPSKPPQNVTLETVSGSSVIVKWEPPPDDALNGIITGYKIRYKRKGSRGSDVVTTDGNRRTHSLNDLMRSTEYLVRLQALTVNGSSKATPWMSAETFLMDLDETTVPGTPSSLRVRPFSDSIAVSWTPPSEQNIMVRGYIVGYGVGIPDVYKQALDSKQRYHTIKALRPSVQYVISLRAFNNLGEGIPVYETVTTREDSAPEPMTPMVPPVGLNARVLSPNTIMVMWSDNALGRNQRITDNRYYTVRYSGRGARKAKQMNATSLNIHIDDLKPNTEYEFAVKVIKGHRQSTWSMSVFNKTYEGSPSTAPRDLTPVAVEDKPNAITLSWQPPRQSNGQVTGYLVFYTTDNTQNDRDWVVEGVLGDKLSTTIRDLTPETTYYFKIQAHNSKGIGPMSPTVIFRTPSVDGTGGGQVEFSNERGQRPYLVKTRKGNRAKQQQSDGIPPMILYIIIACAGAVSLIVIIVITVLLCRRNKSSERQNRKNGYQPANKSGPMALDIKPPDLWIHDMEMKNIDKSQPETMAVPPIPRDTPDHKSDYESTSQMGTLPKRHNSYMSDPNYDPYDDERQRRTFKPRPIMIPVEQPPPPREPIAMAVPSSSGFMDRGMRDGSMSDSGMPHRPLFPRTQYTPQPVPPLNLPETSTPRVNITSGELSAPSTESLSSLSRYRLRSGMKPSQQQTSPYKKITPMAVVNSKPRSSPMPAKIIPKTPQSDASINSGNSSESELPKSYSAEELTAEMANLEGLMKDLNAITQHEFEV